MANHNAPDPSPILFIEIFKLFLPANPVPWCSIRLSLTPTETQGMDKGPSGLGDHAASAARRTPIC
jgi:hypothetical protein